MPAGECVGHFACPDALQTENGVSRKSRAAVRRHRGARRRLKRKHYVPPVTTRAGSAPWERARPAFSTELMVHGVGRSCAPRRDTEYPAGSKAPLTRTENCRLSPAPDAGKAVGPLPGRDFQGPDPHLRLQKEPVNPGLRLIPTRRAKPWEVDLFRGPKWDLSHWGDLTSLTTLHVH